MSVSQSISLSASGWASPSILISVRQLIDGWLAGIFAHIKHQSATFIFLKLFLASLGVICFAALSGLDLRVLATVNLFILEKKMINVGQSSGVCSLLLTSIPAGMVSHQPVNSDEESGLMSQWYDSPINTAFPHKSPFFKKKKISHQQSLQHNM